MLEYIPDSGRFYALAAECHVLVIQFIVSNTDMGATCAVLVNQKLIRDFDEGGTLHRELCLVAMPFVFAAANLLARLCDGTRPGERLASRYLVVLRKP